MTERGNLDEIPFPKKRRAALAVFLVAKGTANYSQAESDLTC